MENKEVTTQEKPKMLLLKMAMQRKQQMRLHEEIKLNDLKIEGIEDFTFEHRADLNSIKGDTKLDGVNMDNMWVENMFFKTRPTRKQKEAFVKACVSKLREQMPENFKNFSKDMKHEKNIFLRNARLSVSTNGKMYMLTFIIDLLLVEVEKKGVLTKLLDKVRG